MFSLEYSEDNIVKNEDVKALQLIFIIEPSLENKNKQKLDRWKGPSKIGF